METSQLAAANGVLHQMDAAPDDWFSGNRKTEIIAEARFMRALIHYNLLRWFAYHWDYSSPYGVLLRTEPVLASTIAKDRSTVAESYQCIMDDLDFAIDELGLYLTTHASDQEALNLYWSYIKLAKEGREKYQQMYGPLLQTDLTPEAGYAWLKDPWPWEEGGNA